MAKKATPPAPKGKGKKGLDLVIMLGGGLPKSPKGGKDKKGTKPTGKPPFPPKGKGKGQGKAAPAY